MISNIKWITQGVSLLLWLCSLWLAISNLMLCLSKGISNWMPLASLLVLQDLDQACMSRWTACMKLLCMLYLIFIELTCCRHFILLVSCRWLCYCRVPTFCDSLPKYELTAIFGRTLIKSIFATARRQIMEKFEADREKMPVEKRPLVLEQFPKWVVEKIL